MVGVGVRITPSPHFTFASNNLFCGAVSPIGGVGIYGLYGGGAGARRTPASDAFPPDVSAYLGSSDRFHSLI